MASKGTSCAVIQDKSAYWTPSVYFIGADGTTELVEQVGGMLAYYFLNGKNIKAFPPEFQMIAGDTLQRNFTWPVPDPPKSDWPSDQKTQKALSQKALGFNCLDYSSAPEPSLFRHFLPEKSYLDAHCKNGVRFELMFPSCWNGKDADSPSHKAHVAYPDLVIDGTCPDGFDTQLPGLFYETIWNTYAFKDKAGEFMVSNGDPTGFGYHGDFIAGWEPTFLQSAIDTCINLSGKVEDCPLFELQTQSKQQEFKISVPSDLQSEDCSGPRAGLPGGVPIQRGPGYASEGPAQSHPSPPPLPATPSQTSTSPTTTAPAQSVPATSVEGNPNQNQPVPYVDPPMTAAPTPPSASPQLSTLSTLYYTTGNRVDEVIVVEEVVTVSCTSTMTLLPGDEYAQTPYRKRFYAGRRRHHGGRLH
ncbi:MAG: hypothetical protein M1839_003916 [Geoglossum umbratile]|nr:MAG: hypothetical protein M1839_003916 [Geoglossum umbratile]